MCQFISEKRSVKTLPFSVHPAPPHSCSHPDSLFLQCKSVSAATDPLKAPRAEGNVTAPRSITKMHCQLLLYKLLRRPENGLEPVSEWCWRLSVCRCSSPLCCSDSGGTICGKINEELLRNTPLMSSIIRQMLQEHVKNMCFIGVGLELVQSCGLI